MKRILGLDLGTNSIGWALIKEGDENGKSEILGLGSRIIPMSQDILGDFDKGNSVSQTADRTRLRGVRRLHERHILRRERLHRVLHILGFLPEHYDDSIDFAKNFGQFKTNTEPKLVYRINKETNKSEFIFQQSFNEMVEEFKQTQPQLFEKDKKIPYDWTIYYLRKKALTQKIEKEELAWLLLHFNQKRGYYQLRGEDDDEKQNKLEEFYSLQVINVTADIENKSAKKDETWYNVFLENGWVYRRTSKTPLDWIGKTKDFIVTTDIDENGNVKTDKDEKEKRSFRSPQENDWTLIKKKTESDVQKSNKTVGCYIYDTLLIKPDQKINGKLVRTIERKFYKQELETILQTQQQFHTELKDCEFYEACLKELYENNDAHRNNISNKDFIHLFLNDIIFYQRPLKSKKSLISNCPYETRTFVKDGKKETQSLKCIAKSNPLFQEFRLWQFLQNLKIIAREKIINNKTETDVNVTTEFLKTENDYIALFDWLNERKEIKQDILLTSYFKIKKAKGADKLQYRWNYVEDKEYPCNETYTQIASRLKKCKNIADDFLTKERERALWHILYSVEDKHEIEKALNSFAKKHNLNSDFVEHFKKFPPIKKEYGSYSEKAIKKLLPLMRNGKYWDEENIHTQTKDRIDKLLNGEYDEKIRNRVREKAINLTSINDFRNLPLWLVCYIVYDRHSEATDIKQWKIPADIELYLRNEFKQHSLRNPIVEQVITETLRVVKDIWKQYGESNPGFFSEIHIELGREMKNPADVRGKMTNKITENENTNLRIKSLLIEMMNDSTIEDVRPYSPSQQEILKIYEEGILNSDIEIPDDILKISKQSQPSSKELERYKLWLDQKYRSPYTGEMIPLGKLFTTAYQIEHIIPQSRYFDDSFSNKVICEAEVNQDKDNATGFEYIKKNAGKIIDLNFGKQVKIFTVEAYEQFVKQHFANNRGKMKKLLMEDIPEGFIERQMNDTRYISKVVKSLLSNIVREDDEQEATSKHVLSSNGSITTTLKQDWGLNDVWNDIITPRFERMNELTKSNKFGEWTNKNGKKVFQTEVPFELSKGFSKKRIDHRHHAMDALVIACASRNHINYLNNESARAKDDKLRYELRNKLRRIEEIEVERMVNGEKIRKKMNVAKEFIKPWDTFTQDAKHVLQTTVVSFKQNLRIINKTVNKFQHWTFDEKGNKEKVFEKQTQGDSWAIRKSMHKDTVSGLVNLRFKKTVYLSVALDCPEMIVDKPFKKKVIELQKQYGNDKKHLLKFFNSRDNVWEKKDISKVEVYYFSNDTNEKFVASRVNVDESFNSDRIKKSITDSGIIKILLNHLMKYNKDIDGKTIEQPELAFSPDGIDEMNKNIISLNDGKYHNPITKVRTYESLGNKFIVGHTGNKKEKFIEAAKGTNLFFAIYWNDEKKKREFETIPLNEVIEHQKQVAHLPKEERTPVPVNIEKGRFLFSLSPIDLVYVPTIEEQENSNIVNFNTLNKKQIDRIYKMVSSTASECHFIKNNIASLIKSYDSKSKIGEFGSLNKLETSIDKDNFRIKEVCWKLQVDRLGNIIKTIN